MAYGHWIHTQLQYLERIARAMAPLGRMALLLLAAAVSDFFIPWKDMASFDIPWALFATSLMNIMSYRFSIFGFK